MFSFEPIPIDYINHFFLHCCVLGTKIITFSVKPNEARTIAALRVLLFIVVYLWYLWVPLVFSFHSGSWWEYRVSQERTTSRFFLDRRLSWVLVWRSKGCKQGRKSDSRLRRCLDIRWWIEACFSWCRFHYTKFCSSLLVGRNQASAWQA